MKKNLIFVFCVLLGLAWFTAVSAAVNNPRKVEEHLAKASELEAQGIYVDAIAEYESALEYEPGSIEISLKMANAYLQMGSSKKFVNICKKTAEENQNDSTALEVLMNHYIEKNEQASAIKYLNDFTKKYPQNESAEQWLTQLKGSYDMLFCSYKELGAIYNGSMVVKEEELYGLADSRGQELLEAAYEETHPYSKDGLALVCKDGKYIYIDRDGQTRLVADDSYADLGMMSSDRTIAAVNGKYGYLDEKLLPVTEFMWDDLTLISDSVGACQLNGKWALVSKNGKVKTDYTYDDVMVDENKFCAGQKRIFVKEQGSWRMIDKKGESVGELTFEDAHCFSEEGYAAVCSNGSWGFVNVEGELVIEYQYEAAQSFHNGFAAVCVDGKWGYIDDGGNFVIEPQFEMAAPISEDGTASVKLEKWRLIQLDVFR